MNEFQKKCMIQNNCIYYNGSKSQIAENESANNLNDNLFDYLSDDIIDIELSNLPLSRIPKGLPSNLEIFQISLFKNLTKIDFSEFPSGTRDISIEYTSIEHIEGSLPESLEILVIANANLENVTLQLPSQLQMLYLDNCNIKSLELKNIPPTLTNLDLSGNNLNEEQIQKIAAQLPPNCDFDY